MRWIHVSAANTISWSIQPHKKSLNFGIFKQNWMMLRQSASEFKGETAQQVDDGAILK